MLFVFKAKFLSLYWHFKYANKQMMVVARVVLVLCHNVNFQIVCVCVFVLVRKIKILVFLFLFFFYIKPGGLVLNLISFSLCCMLRTMTLQFYQFYFSIILVLPKKLWILLSLNIRKEIRTKLCPVLLASNNKYSQFCCRDWH